MTVYVALGGSHDVQRRSSISRPIAPPGEAPSRVLMETSDLIEMLEAVDGFKLTPRLLQTYSSPRLKLVPRGFNAASSVLPHFSVAL